MSEWKKDLSREALMAAELRSIARSKSRLPKDAQKRLMIECALLLEGVISDEGRVWWQWSLDPPLHGHGFATVYLHFDKRNRLLYVGETVRGFGRQVEHRDSKDWYRHVTETRLVHLADKRSARSLERLLIKLLNPVFNIQLNEREQISRDDVKKAMATREEDLGRFIEVMEIAEMQGILLASEQRALERTRRSVYGDAA